LNQIVWSFFVCWKHKKDQYQARGV